MPSHSMFNLKPIAHPILIALLFLSGCGDDADADKDETGVDSDDSEQDGWLVHAELPDSPFIPTSLEDALHNIVSALSETEPIPDMRLSIIPKDSDGYWRVTMLGAYASVNELGIVGNVTAPEFPEDVDKAVEEQKELISQSIISEYNGIGIAPINSDLTESIDSAADMGIVVITLDSDDIHSKRQFYIGTDNTEAGRTAAGTLMTLIGADNLGTVIIYGEPNEDWIAGYERTKAAEEALIAAGYTVEIVQDEWDFGDGDLEDLRLALETADPKPVGMLGVFSNAYRCAEAAVAAGVIDDVKIAAFDFELETVQYMEAGQIQATHTQRQYHMGMLVPYILYSSIVLGVNETKDLLGDVVDSNGIIDTGLDVVAAERLDEYKTYLNQMGIDK